MVKRRILREPSAVDAGRPIATSLVSIPEQIASALGESILSGTYQPGESIPEQRISDLFGVSRGPVREALRILEREGVIAIVPRHGAKVTKLTTAEVIEIYEIRSTLFGLVAGLFAERRPDGAIGDLRAKLSEMIAIGQSDSDDQTARHARLSAAMAQILTSGCGNQRLAGMVHQVARQVARYTALGLSSDERRRQSIASWRRLITAAAARDRAAAEATAREMVLRTLDHAIKALGDDERAR